MKPEPYFPPAPPLTEHQRWILRASAVPTHGPHPVTIRGAGQFTAARKLVALGLGDLDGKSFRANARGAAAVRETSVDD